jgi:hypothetical protein
MDTVFRQTKFREMSAKFRRISQNFVLLRNFAETELLQNYLSNYTVHPRNSSIERIKLKLLFYSRLYENFAARNFGKILQRFAKLTRNFAK